MPDAVKDAGGDRQAAWDLVIGAYMDGEVSLGRAAELLEVLHFELEERLRRFGALPLSGGEADRIQAEGVDGGTL